MRPEAAQGPSSGAAKRHPLLSMLPRLDLAVIVLHVEGALEGVYRLHPAEAPGATGVPVGPHAVAPHVVILDVRRAERLHARRWHVLLEMAVLVRGVRDRISGQGCG